MPEEILRIYDIADEDMLVRAEVIHDQLVTDLADFTAKFPFIDASTTTALQTSIDSANALPLDNQVLSNQKVLTADVNAQVVLGRRALSNLGIYAKLTYPKDEARQRVFGQDHWADAYNDQEKMMNALEQAHNMATTPPYDANLAAKGFLAADAANLLALANEIRSRNKLQENAKASRPVTTQDRVVQYNSVWTQLQEINLASKVVFADNPAKLESYMLYPHRTSNSTVHITVRNNTGDPVRDATVQLTNTSLASRTTNADGEVTFVSVDMPDLVNVSISDATLGNFNFDDQSVTTGSTTSLEFEIG